MKRTWDFDDLYEGAFITDAIADFQPDHLEKVNPKLEKYAKLLETDLALEHDEPLVEDDAPDPADWGRSLAAEKVFHYVDRVADMEGVGLLLEAGISKSLLLKCKKRLGDKDTLEMACRKGYCRLLRIGLQCAKIGNDYYNAHDSTESCLFQQLVLTAARAGQGRALRVLLSPGKMRYKTTLDYKLLLIAFNLAVESNSPWSVRVLRKAIDTKFPGKLDGIIYSKTRSNYHLKILKMLLDAGINLEERNSSHLTPLQMAVKYGNDKAAEFLVDCGADTKVITRDGDTLLHLAAEMNYLGWMPFLVKRGNINAWNKYRWTPLHTAAYHDDLGGAALLLQAGANVNAWAEGDTKNTPLDVAASGRMRALLVQYGGTASSHWSGDADYFCWFKETVCDMDEEDCRHGLCMHVQTTAR